MINKQRMKGGRGSGAEVGRASKGRDGNGVQSSDGRSNLGSGENNGQPIDPGPGAAQVKTED